MCDCLSCQQSRADERIRASWYAGIWRQDENHAADSVCSVCRTYPCICDYLDYEYEAAAHPWNVARPDYR